MDSYVVPANPEWHAETRQGRYPLRLLDERKALAKEEGLWNLFLPGLAAG
jgi:acyl-CoA dehydrogenase